MNKKKILIIPAADYKEKYENFIPHIFMMNMFGEMNIIHNMKGLPLNEFEHIYITINNRVNELYHIEDIIKTQLDFIGIQNNTTIVKIDNTRNVVETLLRTIEQMEYRDCGIFVKDADAMFMLNDLNNENTVYTYFLEDVTEINPSSKSYVSTTSDDIILNIIEKRVISSEFCAGGYYFNDMNMLMNLFEDLENYDKLYLSNAIYYDILHNDELYRTEQVLQFNE